MRICVLEEVGERQKRLCAEQPTQESTAFLPHRKPLPSLGATAALRQAPISHASTLVCLNSVWLYTCSRSDPDILSALS